MTKAGKWKWGLGIGCSLAGLIFVGAVGVVTWYASRINAEYKEVRDTEARLIAATEGETGFLPPPGGVPGPERIEVFLAVREELKPWLTTLSEANEQFATDRENQQDGGWKDALKLFSTGSDLMPVYAGFWTARNEALLAHEMGPGEYVYIYRLAYHTWLNLERDGGPAADYPSQAVTEVLEPYRDRLVDAFVPEVGILEQIFQKDNP